MGTDPTRPSLSIQAATIAAGAPWGALLLGVLEATRVDGLGFVAAFAAAAVSAVHGAAPALGLLIALALPTLVRKSGRRALVLQAAIGGAFAAILFGGIAGDDVIAGHPAVWAGLLALVAAITAEIWWRERWPRLAPIPAVAALVAGAALWIANYRVAPGVYFEAHWLLTNLTVAALGLGVGLLARASGARATGVAFVVFGFLGLAACAALTSDAAMRRVAVDTEIGRARLLVSPPAEDPRQVTATHDVDVRALFDRAQAFDLPPGFDLADYDVLFVATEAIRRDDTSLHAPQHRTTPQMVKWRDQGAFDLTRGYAPSSGTLQSLSSWFGLTPVACTELDIYKPHWAGKLRPEAKTAAEIFTDTGRHTFWIGHNFRNLFHEKLFGFEQGFAVVERTPEPNKKASARADDLTGDAAAAHIRQLPADQRFFGYVMFSAPHFSYIKHYDDMPARTARDRYRHEIRKADEQLGKLFDALQETGRLQRTVVIITADHGEEFGDHGATGHNRTLYEESIHVPLLVWLPGAKPRDLNRPISTAWLLPWLMLHGESTAAPVAARLQSGWGPMLDAVDGRVVAEIVRGQQTIAALIDTETKLHYDVAADQAYAFDLPTDPGERTKRFALTEAEQAAIDAFAQARRGCQRVRQTGKRPPKTDR